MVTKPLEGIRVVEFATMIAAPSAGRLLANLGAEVIKVESFDGDPYRKNSQTGNQPVIYDMLNMQKKSMAVNAKTPEGNEAIRKLVAGADVFLSNIRTKSLEKLGFGYEELKKDNPGLIYVHFSGYGATGPMKDLPGYDTTAFFTRFGVMSDFVSPDSPPSHFIPGFGDMACGINIAMNVSAALIGRAKTGKGECIECALNQVGNWLLLLPMIFSQYGVNYRIKDGDPPMDVASCNMPCGDGQYIFMANGTLPMFQRMLEAIGKPELISDPRCESLRTVYENTASLYPEIAPAFQTHGADEWVKILREHEVPCERHRKLTEIAEDEQLFANRYIYKPDYTTKEIAVPAPPIDFASMDLLVDEQGPALGQDTAEVLEALGYSQEQIKEWWNGNAFFMG